MSDNRQPPPLDYGRPRPQATRPSGPIAYIGWLIGGPTFVVLAGASVVAVAQRRWSDAAFACAISGCGIAAYLSELRNPVRRSVAISASITGLVVLAGLLGCCYLTMPTRSRHQ